MSCLQLSLQSLAPGILGFPDTNTFIQCSNYGVVNSNANKLTDSVTGTPYDHDFADGGTTPTYKSTAYNALVNQVWLVPWTDDEKKAQTLFGISLLPWNVTQYKRIKDGAALPVNPWNKDLMISNGATVAKIAAAGLAVFVGGKLAYKAIRKR